MQSQTVIFRQLVQQFMRPARLSVPLRMAVSEVVGRMADGKAGCVVVTDGDGRVRGILTEQDVTRRIAFRVTPETTVDQVMTAPVRTARDTDHLYRAIARMRRYGHRHMPVVDHRDALVGVLDLHDALAVASEQIMEQIDLLTHEGTIDGLRQVKTAQVELADQLFADDLPAPEIQALLTDINNDIYRRVVDMVLDEARAEGRGDPPLPFAVIVMGSGGRGENYIFPDQDNGMIVADYPDSEHERIDGWFRHIAERMNTRLDEVGFPLCKGHVMARNPLWRKTLPQWKAQLGIWQKKRDVVALRLSDIFFDFRGVYGPAELAAEVRREVTRLTRGNPAFLREMYHDEAEHRVALGLFNRFITEKHDPAHKGELNLKITGTIPLVEGVRLLALGEGVEETPTLARIDRLAEARVLDRDEQDELSAAFRFITGLLLRQQIADFRAGRRVSNFVSPKTLTRRQRDELVDSLKAIRSLRKRLHLEFTGEIF